MLGWFGFGAYEQKVRSSKFQRGVISHFSVLSEKKYKGGIGAGEKKMEGKTEKENKSVKKTACDVEALKKCLEENKGDYLKCQSHVEAFRSSCSINNSNSSSPKLNSDTHAGRQ
uniref:Uncharacterized protein n=1 Tax=Solanum lycopersicum TaxID=4081 RepID=A0A3Q7FH68_SOLLC